MRILRLLADRGSRLEADEEEDAEQDPAEDTAARDSENRGLARIEHGQGVAVLAALADDHDGQDQHRDERDDREREHRPDRKAHAEVVEDEDDPERDHPPHPPGRAAIGDVRRPEPVDQHAEPEIDPPAAEEQRPDEEEPGREDADPGVRTVRQVLVDRAGTSVLPRVERDRVGDRKHAEPGQEHGERGVPAGPDVGARDTAEDERNGEHRPDRERLGDRVHRREVLLAERAIGGAALSNLAHACPPPSDRRTTTCASGGQDDKPSGRRAPPRRGAGVDRLSRQ